MVPGQNGIFIPVLIPLYSSLSLSNRFVWFVINRSCSSKSNSLYPEYYLSALWIRYYLKKISSISFQDRDLNGSSVEMQNAGTEISNKKLLLYFTGLISIIFLPNRLNFLLQSRAKHDILSMWKILNTQIKAGANASAPVLSITPYLLNGFVIFINFILHHPAIIIIIDYTIWPVTVISVVENENMVIG